MYLTLTRKPSEMVDVYEILNEETPSGIIKVLRHVMTVKTRDRTRIMINAGQKFKILRRETSIKMGLSFPEE